MARATSAFRRLQTLALTAYYEVMRPAALLLPAFWMVLSATANAEPLDDPVVGPTQVCFKYSAFSLDDGERIVGFEGGAEGMAVTVEGPAGAYRIGESEIFATPRLGRVVSDRDGTRVYRLRGRAREYAIRGTTSFSDGEDRTVIRLEGEALTGTSRDAQIYRRFTITDPSALHCPRTFTYSWDAMLGLPDT